MKASRIALGAALALGSYSAIASSPASAQAPVGQPTRLTKEERATLATLVSAVQAQNWVAASAALPAAQAVASSDYARYLVANQMFAIAAGRNDAALQSAAVEALIASGNVPATELPALYRARASFVQRSSDARRQEAGLTQHLERTPNDLEALAALSEMKEVLRKPAEALRLLDRAIEIRRTSGQPVPETWYKRALRLAFDTRLAPESMKYARALLELYPTPSNWRDATHVYRTLAGSDPAAALDAMRLNRSAKALGGERDYLELAQALSAGGLAAESKSVLDEGVASRMIDPAEGQFKALLASSAKQAAAQRTGLAARQTKASAAQTTGAEALAVADATFATGNYARAAEFYGAALAKGGVDAGLVNNRLGISLALAGRRPEAEAALRAVSGPRAELASLWLLWLNQRG
ncbi:MAG TPA: hypothetical protein VF631_09140 [Allosphingosinicella sp.]|uniref:hypothetical protein n=1 Tax=Allosphingosinicella sp. TaxID=2823234 RepID=UPI002F2A7695